MRAGIEIRNRFKRINPKYPMAIQELALLVDYKTGTVRFWADALGLTKQEFVTFKKHAEGVFIANIRLVRDGRKTITEADWLNDNGLYDVNSPENSSQQAVLQAIPQAVLQNPCAVRAEAVDAVLQAIPQAISKQSPLKKEEALRNNNSDSSESDNAYRTIKNRSKTVKLDFKRVKQLTDIALTYNDTFKSCTGVQQVQLSKSDGMIVSDETLLRIHMAEKEVIKGVIDWGSYFRHFIINAPWYVSKSSGAKKQIKHWLNTGVDLNGGSKPFSMYKDHLAISENGIPELTAQEKLEQLLQENA
ncbi:hypothetical protein BCU74_03870 [Vibrio breoganii]|nr:hypothetical protein BCU74_03870 [Vibrio breoganii]